MATAVNPLRVDGRRSAANVQVCGWGHPPISHYHDDRMVAMLGLALHHLSIEFRFHALEQQRGNFSQRGRTRTPEA